MESTNQQTNQGYYQNLYNMFGGYNPIIDKRARSVRRLGLIAGSGMIAYTVMQNILVIALYKTNLLSLYQNDPVYMNGINIIGQFISIFIPFLIIYFISKPKEKEKMLIFNKPNNLSLSVYAVFAGLGLCVIANFAGDLLTGIFSASGVDFLSGIEDVPMPDNFIGVLFLIIGNAVVAPLFEEFALRGVIMQPLRKHGDKFAIIASALIFAILHGNMIQAPFAFIAGLALGYFCIVTNSIWVSVAIHCLNNLFASIFSLYADKYPDASGFAYFVTEAAMLVVGIAAYILFKRNNQIKLKKSKDELTGNLRFALYICTPTVVIGIINALYTTFTLQKTTKALGMLMMLAILIAISISLIKGIGLIKMDTRLKQDKTYSVSKLFSIIMLVAGTIYIIIASSASMLTGVTGG